MVMKAVIKCMVGQPYDLIKLNEPLFVKLDLNWI